MNKLETNFKTLKRIWKELDNIEKFTVHEMNKQTNGLH